MAEISHRIDYLPFLPFQTEVLIDEDDRQLDLPFPLPFADSPLYETGENKINIIYIEGFKENMRWEDIPETNGRKWRTVKKRLKSKLEHIYRELAKS